MKTWRPVLLLLIFLLSACQPDTVWTTYTSNKGNFSVLMPQTPVEKHETQDMGPIGLIGLFSYLAEGGFGTFLVCYADFPEDLVKQANPYELLDGAVGGVSGFMLEDSDVQVTNQSKITYQKKYLGREVRVETPDGSEIGVIRIYLVKSRMFAICGAMRSTNFSEDTIKNYLDSFTLLRP
jgi:hypothetical protein